MLVELMMLILLGASIAAGVGVFLWRAGDSLGKGRVPVALAVCALSGGMALFGGAVGYLAVKKKAREVKAGWNLVPVMVAAMDLPAGTTLGPGALEEKPVPEQFVTSSIVKRGELDQVTHRVLVGPMKAGEPVTRLLVGEGLSPDACARAK